MKPEDTKTLEAAGFEQTAENRFIKLNHAGQLGAITTHEDRFTAYLRVNGTTRNYTGTLRMCIKFIDG